MISERLANHLKSLVQAYGDKKSALDVSFSDSNGLYLYKVELSSFALEFVYNARDRISYPVSTLSMRIYLEKDSPVFYEVTDIVDHLDIFDYHCYFFAYIENITRLEACFNYLTDFVDYHSSELNLLALNPKEIKRKKLREMKRVFKLDDSAADDKEQFFGEKEPLVSMEIISSFTTGKPYLAYLNGDFEKAIKEYSKKSGKTSYERKLLIFIKERNNAPYQAIAEECASVLDVQKFKNNGDLKVFAVAIAISTVVFSLLFLLLAVIINAYYKSTADFVCTINPVSAIPCGIVPGIVAAIAFRKKLEPLFNKNKMMALDFFELLNPPQMLTIVKTVFAAVLVVCIFATGVVCRPQFMVKDNTIKCAVHDDSLTTHYKYYHRDELVDVYVIDGYFNDKSEYIESPFYVLKITGKNIINLQNYDFTEEQIKELVKVLMPFKHFDDIDHRKYLSYLL